MAGHSKWSTIKHKKAKTDAQRGKQFSKFGREITMAARLGGDDLTQNPRLRLAVQKAKQANMPNDNIQRAIQKGVGGQDGASLEELIFEAYGPHGVAILIHAVTDNRNRTVSSLKAILARSGGNMASKGAVSYLFEKKGLFLFSSGINEEQVIDLATLNGAQDLDVKEDNSIEVVTEWSEFETLKRVFDEHALGYDTAEVTMMASTSVAVAAEDADAVIALLEKIDDDDDVQEVHANFEIC